MPSLSKQQALDDLRARIETIEKRSPLGRGASDAVHPAADFLALPSGVLHEVFVDEHRIGGAALGFALGAALKLITAERPALIVAQLNRDAQDLGVPYGAGLKAFGIDPDAVVLCRPENIIELLWAVEEAIGCHSVAAVIADIGTETATLDFTASRRLSLRTASGGSTVFLVRYGREREATAARFRWHVDPITSGETQYDARAPGHPRWKVELEKGRLGSRRDPTEWMLDWTENGFALAKSPGTAAHPATRPPLPGAPSAALGHRLSKAG
jgi:protein ImuA